MNLKLPFWLCLVAWLSTPLAFTQTAPPTPPKQTVTPRAIAAPKPVPARRRPPMLVEADLEKEIAASATLNAAPCRPELDAQIARAKKIITGLKSGLIVVGRVVLDGPGDPRDVMAQMQILPGGYFASELGNLQDPLGFRLHQYAPLDVPMTGRTGSLVDIGTVHMQPMRPAELVGLKGKLVLNGKTAPTAANIHLSVGFGPNNSATNGLQGRPTWPRPISAQVKADGTFSATGFSPIGYHCSISAPGYVAQSREVSFRPGSDADLGVITLHQPKKITLTYLLSDTRPFNLAREQKHQLDGGERWKATSDIFGWDLAFPQEADAVFLESIYGGLVIKDLGKGRLEDFAQVLNTETPERVRERKLPAESGHVYLQHQQKWNRWIAFEVQIK